MSKELTGDIVDFGDYLRRYFDANITEFRLAIKAIDDKVDEVLVIVHPLRVDGTTLDLIVCENEILFEGEGELAEEVNDQSEDQF